MAAARLFARNAGRYETFATGTNMNTVNQAFCAAHASGKNWAQLTESCLDQLEVLPDGADLGFLYATDALDSDLDKILEVLREATGVEHWVGTVGFGVCASGQEYFDTPAMTVMVGAFGASAFKILPNRTRSDETLPGDVRAWIEANHPILGIAHGDPNNPELLDLIENVTNDTGCFLVGGLSASRGRTPQIADEVIEGGVSGVMFAGGVKLATGLTQGCSPIGPMHQVTQASGNVMIKIDGRIALDVFKEDIGDLLSRDLSRAAGYVHAGFPVTGSDTGDYLVRNVISINSDEGWVAVGESVEVGDTVLFVRRDGKAAFADLKRMVGDVFKRAGQRPKAALYYSCIARGPNLFGENSEELRAVADVIGDVPLVGFYANGEICNNRLYGYTGVLTLFV